MSFPLAVTRRLYRIPPPPAPRPLHGRFRIGLAQRAALGMIDLPREVTIAPRDPRALRFDSSERSIDYEFAIGD